jgi:hypothetical protein
MRAQRAVWRSRLAANILLMVLVFGAGRALAQNPNEAGGGNRSPGGSGQHPPRGTAGGGGTASSPNRTGSTPAGWTRVAPPGAGFSVALPGAPRIYSRMLDTPAGQQQAHYVSSGSGQSLSAVIYLDSTGPMDSGAALRAFSGDLPKLGAVASESDIQFHGYPAQRFVVVQNPAAVIDAIIFATPRRLYELLHRGAGDYLEGLESQQFFDSFQLSGG